MSISSEEDINIISNSDIYFDESLSKLKYIKWDAGIALACSRWDVYDGTYKVYPTCDSQDFWIFKGSIKGMYSAFPLGKPGSDNRIAWEINEAGYCQGDNKKD